MAGASPPASPLLSDKKHAFAKHTWTKPKLIYCVICNKALLGVYHQGLKCEVCGQAVHAECQDKAGPCATLYGPFFLGSTHPTIKPLFVLINPKSGGKQGVEVQRHAVATLGADQVFSLADGGPAPALRQLVVGGAFRDCQLLVCGGDGTVGWVLSTLDEINCANEPAVAILPLGTGNDLSRSLGWGPGDDGRKFWKVLDRLFLGIPVMLDRWTVTAGGQPRKMCNYFSIGIDASITLAFHQARERDPARFSSREVNKWTYMLCAVEEFMTAVGDLDTNVSCIADGKEIRLPKGCAGLIVLNLPSYGAGADLWGNPAGYQPATYYDMLLEVCTVTSVAQLGAIQAGTRTGDPLCQCRALQLTTTKNYAMQVDGEPWMQPSTNVDVAFSRQSKMLRYNPPSR